MSKTPFNPLVVVGSVCAAAVNKGTVVVSKVDIDLYSGKACQLQWNKLSTKVINLQNSGIDINSIKANVFTADEKVIYFSNFDTASSSKHLNALFNKFFPDGWLIIPSLNHSAYLPMDFQSHDVLSVVTNKDGIENIIRFPLSSLQNIKEYNKYSMFQLGYFIQPSGLDIDRIEDMLDGFKYFAIDDLKHHLWESECDTDKEDFEKIETMQAESSPMFKSCASRLIEAYCKRFYFENQLQIEHWVLSTGKSYFDVGFYLYAHMVGHGVGFYDHYSLSSGMLSDYLRNTKGYYSLDMAYLGDDGYIHLGLDFLEF